MDTVLETTGLTRRFGRQLAVDRVSLSVPKGAVYGFLGRNGAGKTTAIRLVLGLLRADAGEIVLLGRRSTGRALRTPPGVGSLIETPAPYDHLTGRENLDLTRRLLGLPRTEIDRVLEVVELTTASDRRAGGYSLGMRQRLGLARALLGAPRLLVLDEPTNGMDPEGIRDVRALILGLARDHEVTVLVSSHLLSEVEQVASHVGVMHEGRLLAQSTLAALRERGRPLLELECDREGEARETLALAGVSVRAGAGGRLLLEGEAGRPCDPAELNRLLVRRGVAVSHLSRRVLSLDDLYANLTAAA